MSFIRFKLLVTYPRHIGAGIFLSIPLDKPKKVCYNVFCKYFKCVEGKKVRKMCFQRAVVWCETVTPCGYSSSPSRANEPPRLFSCVPR